MRINKAYAPIIFYPLAATMIYPIANHAESVYIGDRAEADDGTYINNVFMLALKYEMLDLLKYCKYL